MTKRKKSFFSLNHVIVYSPFCRHHIRNVFCCRKTFLCASSFSLFLTHIVRIHYCDITLHYLGLNNALFSLRIQCEFKRYVLITLFINFTPSAWYIDYRNFRGIHFTYLLKCKWYLILLYFEALFKSFSNFFRMFLTHTYNQLITMRNQFLFLIFLITVLNKIGYTKCIQ